MYKPVFFFCYSTANAQPYNNKEAQAKEKSLCYGITVATMGNVLDFISNCKAEILNKNM